MFLALAVSPFEGKSPSHPRQVSQPSGSFFESIMDMNRRYPIRYTIIAGLAGAIAWGLPYPISPFLQLIPFMPNFPVYEAPPFHVPLAELTFSYALTGIIAGSLFLLGIRSLPINRERYLRPSFSLAASLALLIGLAIGGAVAILIGLLAGSSYVGWTLAYGLGFGFLSLEPYLSIGWVLGTGIAVSIFCFFSGVVKQFDPIHGTPFRSIYKIVLKAAMITLIVRSIACLAQMGYLSFTSNYEIPLGVFMISQVISGAFFGICAWSYFSRFKAS